MINETASWILLIGTLVMVGIAVGELILASYWSWKDHRGDLK